MEELLQKLVKDSNKYGFKWLGDYAFQYEDLFVELRTETLTDENNCWEMDFAVFESEKDMNTDYDLNIAEEYYNIENAEEYWNYVKDIISNARANVEKVLERKISIILQDMEHRRFKTIKELEDKIKEFEGVYSIKLIEDDIGEKVCDDFLIGTIGISMGKDNLDYDIQLYYIKDNLGQYYITETEMLQEAI